jgi:hypothetical protein
VQVQIALCFRFSFVAWSACEIVGCASFILSSHSSFNFALAADFKTEVWLQDLWTGHVVVVEFCMIFAH